VTAEPASKIADILRRYESELLADWLQQQQQSLSRRRDLISDRDLESQSREFLHLMREAVQSGALTDVTTSGDWARVRDMLRDVSRSRGLQGFSPSETASFIFSLKPPLFARVRAAHDADPEALFREIRRADELIDNLGLYTTEVFQKGREEVILRQQQDMLELSTPVVKLWDGILALPMIGTLDSARTQIVMETLLQRHPDCAASHQDRHGGAADGRRLHHQRHPPPDRPDHRPSRRAAR
jgi:rsbT co-antagonist protein RsbR